ncbi:MAG: 2'-5' RNA ligase family protein [Chloroflexi bacterium]|nr:2'-5' RNA ligase family protein [Chloroflexota bacterium]
MIGIASLLDLDAGLRTRGVWEWLEEHCGLTGIRMTPLPHFSWQTAENYPQEDLLSRLDEIVQQFDPVDVNSTGIGLFTGANPVLYLSVVKNRQLLEYHRILWETFMPLAQHPNLHYAPENWIPHITIAYHDLTPETLACAIRDLGFHPLGLQIHVNHLAVIYQTDGKYGIISNHPFAETSPDHE